jgi:hypothetical protein
VADSVTDEAKDKADEATDSSADPTDKVEDSVENTPTADDDKLIAPLKKVAIAAAVAALTPIVKDAVRNGAESAVKRAPELLGKAGGWKGIADLAKEKLGDEGLQGVVGKLGGESEGSSGRTARRTKSSSDGRRTASSSAARAKSSGRARSQSARGDGAPASGRGRSETTAGRRGRMSSPYEQRSKDDLEKRAQELGIEGRSKMDKGELIDALRSKSRSGGS